MHIDWFVVFILAITFLFAGYALWLDGKGKDEKPPSRGDEAEKPTSR